MIKCVVWDLDNTIWEGVLAEDPTVTFRAGVPEVLEQLDQRGILQSIASRNEADDALEKMRQMGIAHYFVFPRIGWQAKSASVAEIANRLNLGLDSFAFIDDEPFERAEVAYSHPEVLCLDPAEIHDMLQRSSFCPALITEDSRQRRIMVQTDMERQRAETEYQGPQTDFLATLNMRLTISPASEQDLRRAEELTVRTHQLNSTGRGYSYEELGALRQSRDHLLLIASLEDRFGGYGKIGLSLIERNASSWTLKLLLTSCRVLSRGIGNVILQVLIQRAAQQKVGLFAEMIPNERNRMMQIAFRLAGFKTFREEDGAFVLEHVPSHLGAIPDYIRVACIGW